MSTENKKPEENANETVIRGVKFRHVKAVIKGIKKWDYKFTGTEVDMVDGLGKTHKVPDEAISVAVKLAKVADGAVSDKSTVRHYLALEEGKLIVLEKPAKTKASKERVLERKAAHKSEKRKSMRKAKKIARVAPAAPEAPANAPEGAAPVPPVAPAVAPAESMTTA